MNKRRRYKAKRKRALAKKGIVFDLNYYDPVLTAIVRRYFHEALRR